MMNNSFPGKIPSSNRPAPFRDATTLKLRAVLGAAVVMTTLAACNTIATYDQAAYEHATAAKVDALALISKATGDYESHLKDIEALQNQLDKAYEYDAGRPLNRQTIDQWNILLDPNRDSLGGFLKEWKESGSLKPVYVMRKKAQIGKQFDQIIGLESGKIKHASE
jgi:hypothetical protein